MTEESKEAELDKKIAEAFHKISEKLSQNSEKKEQNTEKGYAIIGRYYVEDGKPKGVEKVKLTPGKCAVFLRGGGVDLFDQIDIVENLDKYSKNSNMEIFAYVHSVTGSLLFGRGEKAQIIGKDTLAKNRILNAEIGKMNYGIVWGENKKEAENSLNNLVIQRLHGLS